MRVVFAAAGFAACGAMSASRAGAPFAIDAQAIGAGSARATGNSCSRLTATIGEPAPGFSSGGGFELSAGFQAIVAAAPPDAIYFDGFEGCIP